MNDCMTFPDTVEEFMEQYKVVDTEHIYTNGSEFVPIFRMKQWFEHLPSAQPDIIHCKDCKHLCNEDGLRGMCWHINGFGTDIKDKNNSFCSWAERRKDATD